MATNFQSGDTVEWSQDGRGMRGLVQTVDGDQVVVRVWDRDLKPEDGVDHTVQADQLTLESRGRA